jgi:hypothetical protein
VRQQGVQLIQHLQRFPRRQPAGSLKSAASRVLPAQERDRHLQRLCDMGDLRRVLAL